MAVGLFTLLVASILISELILWELFRRKLKGIMFPHELDTSFFRFFTVARLRLVAIGHTIFLLLIVIVGFWAAW